MTSVKNLIWGKGFFGWLIQGSQIPFRYAERAQNIHLVTPFDQSISGSESILRGKTHDLVHALKTI